MTADRIKHCENVLVFYFDHVDCNWEQWVLLSSDRHHDNPHCDRELELEHLQQAEERDAIILDFGDLFCAMQGKYDPRKSYDDIRPEDKGEDYIDRIVKHAADFYGPYAHRFGLIGKGNHETAILKHNSVDLTNNLVHRLNSDYGGRCVVGGYGGWVRFRLTVNKTKSMTLNLKYHHGSGGGGEVTKGVIQTNRQAVYQPDAHIVVNGHTHDGWIVPLARERLSDKDIPSRDLLHFVRTPGYKNEYGDGSSGFANEKWRPPRPLGAVWLRLSVKYHNKLQYIEPELTMAVK